jgi:hypothetical protein
LSSSYGCDLTLSGIFGIFADLSKINALPKTNNTATINNTIHIAILLFFGLRKSSYDRIYPAQFILSRGLSFVGGYSKSNQQQFCGEIRNYDTATELATIGVKNKFSAGDKLELILPEGNQDITVESMENRVGHAMLEASGSGCEVNITLPEIHSDNEPLARYTS